MPSSRSLKGKYFDVCFPCTEEAHTEFTGAVMSAYEQAKNGVSQSEQQTEILPLEYDVRIHSLHPGNGSLRGSASVSLNGQFAIRRVGIMESSKGLFVSLPGFRGGNGMLKDYCFPYTEKARAEFDKAVLGAYEQALTQSQAEGQNRSGRQQTEEHDPFEERASAPVMQM
jgi:stage V sporulation protein G